MTAQDSFVVDPFTQVHNALWEKLRDWPGLQKLIRLRNWISLIDQDDPDPLKSGIQDGDLPEIALLPSGGTLRLHATSSSHTSEQSFELKISSGEIAAVAWYAVKWEIAKALYAAGLTLGLDFVRDVDVDSQVESLEEDRGRIGWIGTITIRVSMWFNDDDMATEI